MKLIPISLQMKSRFYHGFVLKNKRWKKQTEGAIQNGHTRDSGNTRHKTQSKEKTQQTS